MESGFSFIAPNKLYINNDRFSPERTTESVSDLIKQNYKGAPLSIYLMEEAGDLPWELIEHLEIEGITNEDKIKYRDLVQNGKLKSFKATVEGADLLDVEYKV